MKNVIACIDGSNLTQQVLDASAWCAEKMDTSIVLLHALEREVPKERDLSGTIGFSTREHLLEELTELDEKRAKLALEHSKVILEYAEAYYSGKTLQTSKLQRHGNFIDTLRDLEEEARLFVVGKQGTSHPEHEVIGSNLESAARSLSQPMLVVSGPFNAPQSFMIAYDGNETSHKALQRIANSPLLRGIPCHLVMVRQDKQGEQQTLETAKAELSRLGFNVEAQLIEGDNIHVALLEYQRSHNIDLIAMGAYGHSKVRQFFVGSNTTKMLTDCTVPVIILR